jgi:hypothetical protein
VSAPPPDLRPSAVAIWDLDLPSNRNWIACSFGIGANVPNRCSPSQFAPDENQPLLSPPANGILDQKAPQANAEEEAQEDAQGNPLAATRRREVVR